MTEDNEGRGTNEPEEGAQWRSPKEEWNPDYEQTGVERLLGDGVFTELKRVRAWRVGQGQYLRGALSRAEGSIKLVKRGRMDWGKGGK